MAARNAKFSRNNLAVITVIDVDKVLILLHHLVHRMFSYLLTDGLMNSTAWRWGKVELSKSNLVFNYVNCVDRSC
ncbi:hypothetical protein Plhal304r1_c070g0158781 [Plasmopara halstedii]